MCQKIGNEIAELCKECGGKCCTIYANYQDGGWRDENTWWEDWVSNFHGENGNLRAQYGVEPLYDASRIHLLLPMEDKDVSEKELQELKEKEIDIKKCEYCSSTGCIIPREKRSSICTNFMCSPMKTLLTGERFPKEERLSHLYEKFNIPFKTQDELNEEIEKFRKKYNESIKENFSIEHSVDNELLF